MRMLIEKLAKIALLEVERFCLFFCETKNYEKRGRKLHILREKGRIA